MTSVGETGVIFDLDGVLADSRGAIVASFRHALVSRGHADPGEERLAACIGPPPFVAIAEILGTDPDDAEVGAVVEAYRADYGPTYLDRTTAFPGIVEAVRALSARHRLAVATSKPRRYAVPLVERIGLAHLVTDVAGPGDDKRSSSKTAEVQQALTALAVERAVMVGDRRFDVEAGRAHGLATVGVLWGIGDRAELEAAGADVVIGQVPALAVACDALLCEVGA